MDAEPLYRKCAQIASRLHGGILEKKVKDFLSDLVIGLEAHHQHITVYAILAGSWPSGNYLSLDDALAERFLEVTEISDGGEVPNLKLVNHGPAPILILAGEELIGAKQNRVVNATFLIQDNFSITIPVSCVEQGRWSYRSCEFASERRMSPSGLRSGMEEDVSLLFKRCQKGMILTQVQDIVEKYLRDKPQNRHRQGRVSFGLLLWSLVLNNHS
jgi:hypothetical protein